ncbi:MAG: hypothetical protein IPM82_20635 [Saprospiraceae bacterium]|nr:hypothetical protein [Saprospiraceae bacterium]
MKTHFILRLAATGVVVALSSLTLFAGATGSSQLGRALPTTYCSVAKQEAIDPKKPRKGKNCKGVAVPGAARNEYSARGSWTQAAALACSPPS